MDAFGQQQEANIVDALRKNNAVLLSLVATINSTVVGYIIYSPISIDGKYEGAALGPMAVLPKYQNQGIGSSLVREGNARIKASGYPYIIVLGHEKFYPRFGFKPASQYGVACEWKVPDNVFMLLVLNEARMKSVSGMSRFRSEFSTIE